MKIVQFHATLKKLFVGAYGTEYQRVGLLWHRSLEKSHCPLMKCV